MKNKKFRRISLIMAIIMVFTIYLPSKYVRADIIETTIPTGRGPWDTAVNPNTNKIYVVNQKDNNIEVIDGDNLNNHFFVNISNPTAVAVNPQTNKIYAASIGSNLTVIDGTTNTITNTIPVGTNPCSIAVDETRNIIYSANYISNNVTIIDGNTNNVTATVPVGTNPRGIAVNPDTNKIYVANENSSNVTVIDGNTRSTTNVNIGTNPFSIAVNPVTNKIYVANGKSYDVTIIDGVTNSINNINVGGYTLAVAVNSGNNKIYFSDGAYSKLDIIDGETYKITKVPVGNSSYGIALNTQTQSIYVNNYGDNTLTILDGHTYNVAYDANGGNGTGPSDTYNYNISDAATVKSNTFINDGYCFTGWNTSVDGTGTSYSPGSTFNISSNVILYAQWKLMPKITGVSPVKGLVSGGTSIVITGTGFTGATSVKFGSANAASFTVNSDNQITATSPAGSNGAVDITVTTVYGTSAVNNSDVFTYFSPASVSSVAVPADGTYIFGDTLNFTVNYDQNVTVTGTPELALTIGSSIETASYVSGSGTNALVFSYTVQLGDKDSDGIALGSSIALSGGTIKGSGDFDAGLGINSTGSTAGILVDGVVPVFDPASGTTLSADNKTITLTFSKPVVNALPDGTALKNAVTLAADGTNFNALGTNDNVVITDGKVVITLASPIKGTASKIRISGESLKDAVGNIKTQSIVTDSISENVIPAYTAEASSESTEPLSGSDNTITINVKDSFGNIDTTFSGTKNVAISGVQPEEGSALYGEMNGTALASTSGIGQAVKVNFNNGSASFNLKLYNSSAIAFSVEGLNSPNTNGITINAKYSVTYNGNGNDGGAVPLDNGKYSKNSLVTPVSKGSLVKTDYTFTGWNTAPDGNGTSYIGGSSFSIVKNTTLYAQWKPMPKITSVSPNNSLMTVGTTVIIKGTGFTGATAVKFGGTSANYTVDSDSQITALAPYGNVGSVNITVTTAYGTSVVNDDVKFTYVLPASVSSVTVPTNGIYEPGTTLYFIVNYSYPVTVTGDPLLAIKIGSSEKTAHYIGGNGTNKLMFTYTVQTGDNDNDGIVLDNSIELNGGTIKGVVGFDAGLTLNNVGSTKGILTTDASIAMSNGDSTTLQIPVIRTTDASGTVSDIAQIAQSSIESAAGVSAGTLSVNDPSNNFSVTVSEAAIHSLADKNASIAFSTPSASVGIPVETIAGLSSDITVQFSEVRDASALMVTEGVIAQCAPGAIQLSTPYKIETNYLGRTQVTIPISSSRLQASPTELQKFLSQLAVMIQHSDGENVLQKGEIIYDKNSSPTGVAIWVDKFSTFTLVQLADTTKTTSSTNTTGITSLANTITSTNSGSNSTSGSKTLVKTGAVIDYKLQIASGLIIVLLGVMLAIAGKKREDL